MICFVVNVVNLCAILFLRGFVGHGFPSPYSALLRLAREYNAICLFIKIVQERLGHSSIGITMDIYSHVMPNMQRDAIADFTMPVTPAK